MIRSSRGTRAGRELTVGGWENNTKADSHESTRRWLVADLREKHPKVMAFGEMHYDALLSFIAAFHMQSESAYRPAYTKYARAFQHLSPAPLPSIARCGGDSRIQRQQRRHDPSSKANSDATV